MTVDELQKLITHQFFADRASPKKAAGRALGALVELVTYYKLVSWGFQNQIIIENKIAEFGRPKITHNVEFSIHKVQSQTVKAFDKSKLPLTASKFGKLTGLTPNKSRTALSKNGLYRNSSEFIENEKNSTIANISSHDKTTITLNITQLLKHPSVIIECKRVGVEEGMKKGPQSIEKAKQGAYVARSVSSLQKVTIADGTPLYFNPAKPKGNPINVTTFLENIAKGRQLDSEISDFVMTVGIVSNHGNWFTSNNMNKELKVLAHSYDWLLFLTDQGLSTFVKECLVKDTIISNAFRNSHDKHMPSEKMTKVTLPIEAHFELLKYFSTNDKATDSWFNILTPRALSIAELKQSMKTLVN